MRSRFANPIVISLACALAVTGCTLPSSGFLRRAVTPENINTQGQTGIQIVDVTDAVARQILEKRTTRMFSETLGTAPIDAQRIGAGDVVEVSVWEAPPAVLFAAGPTDPRVAPAVSRVSALPEQVVNNEGFINIPFAGTIAAAGKSASEIEADIVRKLKDKANQPQVLVRVIRNVSSNVTIVGDVGASVRMPLTPAGEKLMDAIAAAGGVRQPVNKMTIQVTRGNKVHTLPLETIIRDPRQNVPMHPGDVVTALFQPLSFTSLGATGKNDEINFEAQGISLAQALARTGGLNDNRADSQGVFIFRFEPLNTLKWPRQPVETTPEGQVPVIYRVDLKDPRTFFVAQSFPINNKDVIYVSNASAAELQKFLNLIFSVIYPIAAGRSIFQ